MDELKTSARIDEFRIDIASQSAGLYQRAILLDVMLDHTEEAFNLSQRVALARSLISWAIAESMLGCRRTLFEAKRDCGRKTFRSSAG